MFDLMGAIRRKRQTPPPADSAETAESPQPRGLELAENLRKTADFSEDGNFSATIRKNPQARKTCKPLNQWGLSDLSANPQNPQTPAERKTQNLDTLLLEIAGSLQASPNRLRALLSKDDMQAIAEGEHSRAYLTAYFRLMRSDGKSLADTTTAPMAAKAPQSHPNRTDKAKAWKPAHDAMLNHIMVCPVCRAPRDSYCSEGADLRRVYLDTYQSTASNPEPFPTIKRP